MVMLRQPPHHRAVRRDVDRVLVGSRVAHSCGHPQKGPPVAATAGWGGVGIAPGARRRVRLEHPVPVLTPSSARGVMLENLNEVNTN